MKFDINEVKIELAENNITSPEFKKLVQLWVRDYRIQGDACADASQLYKSILKECSETTLIASYNGTLVGFVCVRKDEFSNVIELAYAVPSLRGKGIATKLYLAALKRFGADEIEVSFKRAKSKVEYWKSLGFKSFKKRYGQGYSMKAICYLSLKDRCHSMLAFPLEHNVILDYLRTQGGNVVVNYSKPTFLQRPNGFDEVALNSLSNLNHVPKKSLLATTR
jgi:N-acetylglutamate synthase-like GNAT family acetyltransferase